MTQPLTHPVTPNPLADKDLLGRVAAGELEALGELFDRHEAEIKRFLGRMGIPRADIDDLVQTTFLEVPRAAVRFDPSLLVKSWLLGLAAMLVRRHRRSLARTAARLLAWTHLPTPQDPANPATAVETDQELRRFQRAFERLSPKKREVFAMVVLEGVAGEDAARALGIPVNTVWTRLHHARSELRHALGVTKP